MRNSAKGSNDAYDVTVSLTKLEALCWSSDIVSTEKLGAIMWSTDDVRSSQEAKGKKRINQHGEPGAPSRGGNATARDFALNYISDSQKQFRFKRKSFLEFATKTCGS